MDVKAMDLDLDLDLALGDWAWGDLDVGLDWDLQEQRKTWWVFPATPRFLFPRKAGLL
jgi:hypothetical protein